MKKDKEETFSDGIDDMLRKLRTILYKKNADYGWGVFKRPRLAPQMPVASAILVRMSDKIERLTSLALRGNCEVADERIEDTMLDLAGYIILYLVARDNPEIFNAPNQEEVNG